MNAGCLSRQEPSATPSFKSQESWIAYSALGWPPDPGAAGHGVVLGGKAPTSPVWTETRVPLSPTSLGHTLGHIQGARGKIKSSPGARWSSGRHCAGCHGAVPRGTLAPCGTGNQA